MDSFPNLLRPAIIFICRFHFQILFGTFVILFYCSVVSATWGKNYGQNNIDRSSTTNVDRSGITSTTNFDSSKYPTCKLNSREKECNVFNECKNVCKTVNKQNCVTRYAKLVENVIVTYIEKRNEEKDKNFIYFACFIILTFFPFETGIQNKI